MSVYLALNGNAVLSVTAESITFDLEMRQKPLVLICLCLAVWLCLKMGSKNMVLVWLLQIGAKDLTVWGPVQSISSKACLCVCLYICPRPITG